MSTPVREPDDAPSKAGPLRYAAKTARRGETGPTPAGAPGTDGVEPWGRARAPPMQGPEPAEPRWEPSNQRPVFAGDVPIAEPRGKLALSPDRIPEPPSSTG